jgi:AbrB family looped-hinge helix DNA binding protein
MKVLMLDVYRLLLLRCLWDIYKPWEYWHMAHKHDSSQTQHLEFAVEIGARGRLVLPVAVRRFLALQEGDKLILTIGEDGIIRLASNKSLATRYRGAYKHLSSKRSLVDELIADRRREAANE